MKRGTSDHPKVWYLCELLHCRRASALGYLTLLWEFAGKYARDGNIGRYSDKRIEAACDWPPPGGKTGELVNALLTAGWLDLHPTLGLAIHDWGDHCEQAILKWLHRNKVQIVCGQRLDGKVTGQSQTVAENVRSRAREDSLPLPLPLPNTPPTPPTNGGAHSRMTRRDRDALQLRSSRERTKELEQQLEREHRP